ncbi:MAG: hypothetical protein OCC49_19320 [Fibrobacterales bacterium]
MKYHTTLPIGILFSALLLQGCLTDGAPNNPIEDALPQMNESSSSSELAFSSAKELMSSIVDSKVSSHDCGVSSYSSSLSSMSSNRDESSLDEFETQSSQELSSFAESSSMDHESQSSSVNGGSEEPVSSDAVVDTLVTKDAVRSYIFGHSLINHQSRFNTTANELTMVPYWMHQFAESEGRSYGFSGQYGFLGGHSNLPPNPQWGIESVPGVWDDDDGRSFAEVDFNTILLTPANFVQYKPATENNYNDDNSPVSYTNTIFNWVTEQEPGIELYIYENWPDMGGLAPNFDPEADPYALPTADALEEYYAHTLSSFHDWFLEYHDEVRKQNPSVKMIPVGPILAKLFTETSLSSISVTDLYEDNAPHGTPTLYFLAGMITYMGMYAGPTPVGYTVPDSVHEAVRNSYSSIRSFIWDELQGFNFDSGESRVF